MSQFKEYYDSLSVSEQINLLKTIEDDYLPPDFVNAKLNGHVIKKFWTGPSDDLYKLMQTIQDTKETYTVYGPFPTLESAHLCNNRSNYCGKLVTVVKCSINYYDIQFRNLFDEVDSIGDIGNQFYWALTKQS